MPYHDHNKQPDFHKVCQVGWIPYAPKQKCVKLFTDVETWATAQQGCEALGGNLISIVNAEEKSFLASKLWPNHAVVNALLHMCHIQNSNTLCTEDFQAILFFKSEFKSILSTSICGTLFSLLYSDEEADKLTL